MIDHYQVHACTHRILLNSRKYVFIKTYALNKHVIRLYGINPVALEPGSKNETMLYKDFNIYTRAQGTG